MIDTNLLRILKHRTEFNRIAHELPLAALDPQTVALAQDFGKYFAKFPEHKEIDFDLFMPRLKVWHKGMTDDQFNAFAAILKNCRHDLDDVTKAGILGDLHELALGTHIANICEQYNAGDLEYPLAEMISQKVDEYKIQMGVRAVMWDDTPIEDLLAADLDDSGLKWRLGAINDHMRGLRPGDFGIIAARPDKGKTTFLASEISFMANQLPKDRNVIWLNNESTSGNIKKRIYQAALGLPIEKLVEMSQKKLLQPEFERIVGRRDRIRIIDIHGFHFGQVEAILEQSNPGLIIYDMMDNIRGFGNEDRTDLQLERKYQWARERCVKYSAAALATSQISSEGDGQQYPTLPMLKDSKTGKQGACDFQLMIGASNDPNMEFVRFLSLPKNKLRKYGANGAMYREVKYLPQIGRYADIELDGTTPGIGIKTEVI